MSENFTPPLRCDACGGTVAQHNAMGQCPPERSFNTLWPTLVLPGEFDAMDALDQMRWKDVIRTAFEAGIRISTTTTKG